MGTRRDPGFRETLNGALTVWWECPADSCDHVVQAAREKAVSMACSRALFICGLVLFCDE